MNCTRSTLSFFLAAGLAGSVPAQGLDLTVHGGSVPGQITVDLGPGTPFVQGAFVILSLNSGPTPLSILQPSDPRSLRVGFDLLEIAQAGPFGADGRYVVPPIPVPNQPSLYDGALYFQGLAVPGQPLLVDRISEPRAVRFGPAGQFRSRQQVMAQPRSFHIVLDGQDGKKLVAGGGSGAMFAQVATKSTELFDPITDQFSPGPDMTVERSLHTATRLNDGRWLLVGGVNRNNDPQVLAEIWDPVAETFTAAASMATQRMAHAAVLLSDGRVHVSGGLTDLNAPNTPIDPIFSTTNTAEIYDPVADSWSAAANLSRPRAAHAAILRPDGNVLLAGGVSYSFIFPSIESSTDIYRPGNNSVVGGPSLRQGRAQPSVVEIAPDRWLLAGGVGTISLTQWGTPTAACEIYDAAANTFTRTGSMAQARTLHEGYAIGGNRWLHVGGADGTLFAAVPVAGCEIYDATAGSWSGGPSLGQGRAAYGSYETATGQLHVVGGTIASGVDNTGEFHYR